MSYTELDPPADIPWLSEPNCELPEQKKEGSLIDKVPILSSFTTSSGQGIAGKVMEGLIATGLSSLVTKVIGAPLAIAGVGGALVEALGPYVGWAAEKGATQIFKAGVDKGTEKGAKAAGTKFSPNGAVKAAARGAAMRAEEAITGQSGGRARFRMQVAMGDHGAVGPAVD